MVYLVGSNLHLHHRKSDEKLHMITIPCLKWILEKCFFSRRRVLEIRIPTKANNINDNNLLHPFRAIPVLKGSYDIYYFMLDYRIWLYIGYWRCRFRLSWRRLEDMYSGNRCAESFPYLVKPLYLDHNYTASA